MVVQTLRQGKDGQTPKVVALYQRDERLGYLHCATLFDGENLSASNLGRTAGHIAWPAVGRKCIVCISLLSYAPQDSILG